MTYGQRIRDLRGRAGLTQTKLARAIGVSSWTVSAIETGRFAPTMYFCIDLADYLGISIDELLGFEHKPFTGAKTPRQYRVDAGLTQKQLAELAQVHARTVSSVENLEHAPTIYTIVQITHALGLGVDEYIGRLV